MYMKFLAKNERKLNLKKLNQTRSDSLQPEQLT